MADEEQPVEETGVHDAEMTNVDPLLTAPPDQAGIVKEPSQRLMPNVTEEDEARMSQELTPTHVMGPPGYASPDPATNAGRLVEVEDHPLSGDISDDYAGSVADQAEEPASSATSQPGNGAEVDEDGMTKEELQTAAEERGLSTSGTKAEIAERIRAYDNEQTQVQ